MENCIVTAIYQNKNGEISALVEDMRDGACVCRLVENIERIPYTSENIAEEAERGFDWFSEFDPYEHEGISFGEAKYNITENEDYKLIAEFFGNVSEFVPDNMNDTARALFLPLIQACREGRGVHSPH